MIPFGRLADIYGSFSCYVRGILCFCSFTLGAAQSRSFGVLLAARACQGIGAAVFLPAGIKLILESYPRGRRRNIFFGIYAATVPLGFFLGNIVAEAAVRSSTWTWYFWGGFILTCVALVCFFAFRPSDSQSCQRDLPIDWLECCVLVTGLIFMVFSLTNTAQYDGHWRSPGILATFFGGVIFLGFAAYLEIRVVETPLIPRVCFGAPMLSQVLVVLFFTYGGFGIYLFYAVLS
jgi:MFS family permease